MNREEYRKALQDASRIAQEAFRISIQLLTTPDHSSIKSFLQSPYNPTLEIGQRFMSECRDLQGACDKLLLKLTLDIGLPPEGSDDESSSCGYLPYVEMIVASAANLSVVMFMASNAIMHSPSDAPESVAILRFFCKRSMFMQKEAYRLIESTEMGWELATNSIKGEMKMFDLGFTGGQNE